jgi:uncharacterized membrane protein YgcG
MNDEHPLHTSRSRDAAVRRVARANRRLLLASTALTGVLAAAAAHAFPGRTVKSGTVGTAKGAHVTTKSTHAPTTSGARATTAPQRRSGSSGSSGSSNSSGSSGDSATGTSRLKAPAQTPTASSTEQSTAATPVVSGGS